MKVSIIIPTHNTKEITLNCSKSVMSLGEVVVIDNGSTDGTVVELKKLGVNVVENSKNLGYAKAVNAGAKASNAELLCFLNSDAILTKESLDIMVDFISKNPDTIVGADLVNQRSFAKIPSFANQILPRSIFRQKGILSENDMTIEVESLVGACMMTTRVTYEKLQGFNEDYFVFLEETDFCFRAHKIGIKSYVVKGARVEHIQGATKKKFRTQAKVEYTRSLFTFFKKNKSYFEYSMLRLFYPPKIFLSAFGLLIANVVTFALLKPLRERLSTYCWLFMWLLTFCPRTMGLDPRGNRSLKTR